MRIHALALALLAIGTLTTATTFAKDTARSYAFRNLSPGAIRLEIPQFKVRVDGWDRDYVELTLNLKAKSPVMLSERANTVTLRIDDYKAPLWEPAVRVRVPRESTVSVRAGKDLWLKGCTVDGIWAGRAYVRECRLLRNPRSTARWGGGWGSREGWMAVKTNK